MKTKRLLALALMLVMLLIPLAGCGSDAQDSSVSTGDGDVTDTVRSDGYDKFSQIKIGMTESEVNAILGEPTSVDKADYRYNVTVNGQDMEVTVWISTVTGQVVYINGDFSSSEYRADLADSNTDLSAVSKLESGEIATYDDCAAAFKTPGYVICEDDKGEKIYLWVDSNDGYMRVTVRADGTIKTYMGFC